MCIEASAPGRRPPLDYGAPAAHPVPEHKILMRFTHAMRDKVGQFERVVNAGLVPRGEPYVVAINSHNAAPVFGGYVPYYLKAFLPIGDLAIARDKCAARWSSGSSPTTPVAAICRAHPRTQPALPPSSARREGSSN